MQAPSPHAHTNPFPRRRRWLATLLGAGLALCGGMALAARCASVSRRRACWLC